MKKFRDFSPTLSDLKEVMFVQKKGNELDCYEVKISDYDNLETPTINGLVLEATEINDKIIFTKTTPNEHVNLNRKEIESIPLLP
ncbi:hypothetical protein [Maribacter dokdonensis]|uniref:hypothetical protein n=1 Tax=Maribacter dokdonensis TaxID=320912 RepID=UPI002733E20A|nr:hypothetical protein [Maribacter dokdonensis]MDP2526482.1 hypothetical protein [Maribacter dokdonensis]